MRYRSSNYSMVFFCVVLISALTLFLNQSANAWPPANTLIVYPGGSSPYYSTITGAVSAASDGDVIILYPGEYTDYGVNIYVNVHFIAQGYVKWSSSYQLFTLGADSVGFQGISFGVTGNEELADMGSTSYFMESCTLRCKNFDFGQGKSHWVGSYICPKTPTGWTISGSTTEVQFRNCKLGDDMPGTGEAVLGLNIVTGAHFAAYYSFFQSDSIAFYVNDSKLNIFYSIVNGNKGPAIRAVGESTVSSMLSTFECQDGTDTYATIMIEDQSYGHFNNCVIRKFSETQNPDRSLYTITEEGVLLIDNNFTGTIELDLPAQEPPGIIKFTGGNTITEGGVDDGTGTPGYRYGNAFKMRSYGEAEFVDDASWVEVFVNGMPFDATVTITYKHTGAVDIGDAVYAVEMNDDGGSFILHRSSTNNTLDLKFNWSAEWETDQPPEE